MGITGILSTAVAGLNAASRRLAVSADNVVNADSSGAPGSGQAYQAKRAVQTATSAGPAVTVETARPPTLTLYAPDSSRAGSDGTVEFPNVDYAREAVDQIAARRDFEAAALLVRSADELTERLLDIKS